MSDFLWTPCRMPGLPVPPYLPKFVQVHIHCTSDTSQPAIHPCKTLHTDIHSSIIDDSQTLKKKKKPDGHQQLNDKQNIIYLYNRILFYHTKECNTHMRVSQPQFSSVQFSSVAQSCLTLCDPMNCSTPGLPVHYQLMEPTQIHVHWVGDAIQPSHPLSSPSPPVLNLSQHQGLFKWVSSLHQVAKVLEFQLQHQSFQWTPRTDFL